MDSYINTKLTINTCISDLYDAMMNGNYLGGIMGDSCGRKGIIEIYSCIVRIKFNIYSFNAGGIFGGYSNDSDYNPDS
jgi:hypothetical protein